MAKRNSARRARAGRRRRNPQSAREPSVSQPAPTPRERPVRSMPVERTRRRDAGALSELKALGERPQAPWHPLPLSELLILVGVIGAIVGAVRLSQSNTSSARATLFAGLGAVAIGSVEVSVREHLSGYRSHTMLLAVLPVMAVDAPLVLAIAPFTPLMKGALLLFDGGLFAVLFKLLRARFLDARRERRFAGG